MKYCWEYTSDYLEYRKSIGLDDRNPKYLITIFSQYLKDNHPQETHLTKERIIHTIENYLSIQIHQNIVV